MLKTYEDILDHIDAIDPVAYAKTRNHLSGAVTQLSPYITRGIVSLPEIRDRLLAKYSASDCEKLIQELAWREYFQNVWWAKEDAIFSDLRFSRDDWKHHELVAALVQANTGVDAIDAGITTLYETGYMHNHVRMWVASVSCNLAKAYWYEMGRWLYYHLIDGDPASNFCSWQWVAGTSKTDPYTVNQKLINGCSDKSQVRTILTYEREGMLEQPIPDILQATAPPKLKMIYPKSTLHLSVADQLVILYTPWTLSPTYRANEVARRILVVDPEWFDRLPVSERVMDFILKQGTLVIENLEIYVGTATEIDGITEAVAVFAHAHQTNRAWSDIATLEATPKLFPAVTGYCPSFFKFWQACTKLK